MLGLCVCGYVHADVHEHMHGPYKRMDVPIAPGAAICKASSPPLEYCIVHKLGAPSMHPQSNQIKLNVYMLS